MSEHLAVRILIVAGWLLLLLSQSRPDRRPMLWMVLSLSLILPMSETYFHAIKPSYMIVSDWQPDLADAFMRAITIALFIGFPLTIATSLIDDDIDTVLIYPALFIAMLVFYICIAASASLLSNQSTTLHSVAMRYPTLGLTTCVATTLPAFFAAYRWAYRRTVDMSGTAQFGYFLISTWVCAALIVGMMMLFKGIGIQL